ncbi:hypothetical protein GTPV_gp062 [Goatpox virus Pellor]|uniref:Thymidine kinase n=1 Tax=Goatpox virus TaxID=186805 RepID=A0A1B2LPN0_9POXV|nr:hypothetical protein GTPV_gp062 [Goatpox virus Pellor]AOA33024.1 hypothetical protein GTPV_gp062 [Goatpox virus]QEJ79064.1 thymidine kinase [Goatpox virus]
MDYGYIHLIIGPMFSGKSTELIRIVKRYQIAQYKCCVVKYLNDIRYGNSVYTHDNNHVSAMSTTLLYDVVDKIMKFDIIGIDEGQFFKDIVPFSENMANMGKIIIIAALDSTFQRKEFNDILKLIPLSEKVTKLNAVCMECYKDAAFSKRITKEKEIELIGGKEKYKSVCRKCYFLE